MLSLGGLSGWWALVPPALPPLFKVSLRDSSERPPRLVPC